MYNDSLCIDLIKKYEGCRLKAYKDPAGVWTIGWGHTYKVLPGSTITQEDADLLLKSDVQKYYSNVMKYDSKYHWNRNEIAALVSFAYNIGSIDQLTAYGTRLKSEIGLKMLKYVMAGGKKLQGLVNRRQEEAKLYMTIPSEADQGGYTNKIVTIDDLVSAVINGQFGNGEERKEKLYKYIQEKVNRRLK